MSDIINIQSFFTTIKPYRVLRDLGVVIQDRGESLIVPHPKYPHASIWVTGDNFVSDLDTDEEFIAGNLYDYLALHLGDYTKAVDFMLNRYKDLAVPVNGSLAESQRDVLINDLETKRKFYCNWLQLRDNLKLRPEKYQRAGLWLHRKKLSVNIVADLVFAASGKELSLWLAHVAEVPAFYMEDQYVVFPYFTNQHTLSRLEIYKSDQDDDYISVDIQTARHHFFGLPTYRPDSAYIFTFSDMWSLLRYYEISHANGFTRFGVVLTHFNNLCNAEPAMLPHATFMYSGQPDLARAARARSAFKAYNICSAESMQSEPWLEFAVNCVQRTVMEDGDISYRVQRLLDDLKLDADIGTYLVRWMTNTGHLNLAKRLQKHVSLNRFLTIGDVEIEETPGGYYYRKAGTTETIQGSNFIVRITHANWFAESGKSFYYGVMMSSGTEVPIVLTQEGMRSPNKLLIELEAALQSRPNGIRSFMPNIYTSKARSYVLHAIRKQEFPSLNGLSRLGWDEGRTIFETPQWSVDVSSIQSNKRAPYPNNLLMKTHFDFDQFTPVVGCNLITSEIRGVIARCVSMLVRNYFRLPVPVMIFKNNDSGRRIVSTIFRAFGQRQALVLNLNDRRNSQMVVPELLEYPVYGDCHNRQYLHGRTGYIAALDQDGEALHTDLDQAGCAQLLTTCKTIFSQVCLGVLRYSEDIKRQLVNNPMKTADYILEGQRIVERVTDFKQFLVFNDDLPGLRLVLANIPAGQLHKYITEAPETGLAYINFRNIHVVERRVAHAELLTVDPSATLFKTYYIAVDAYRITELLCRYYGQDIKLEIKAPMDHLETLVPGTHVVQAGPAVPSAISTLPHARLQQTATGTYPAESLAPKEES